MVILLASVSTLLIVFGRDLLSGKIENVSPQFVGSTQCASCHQQEVKSWQGSHHALAMQHATNETVLGDFNKATYAYSGVSSTFFRKNGKYFVNTDGPDGKLHDYEIKYTFGVHPLQQYLIEFPGGRLQALGIAWDSRPKKQGGQRWYHLYPNKKLTHKDRLHWTKADQNWNFMCAECHSTNLQKNYSLERNAYETSWSEINVACEACHGPASQHVDWAKNKGAWFSSEKADKGLIVGFNERMGVEWPIDAKTGIAKRNKTKTTNREIEVCARCHSRRSVISEKYAHDKPFMDQYLPVLLTDFLYHPDGQIKEEVYVYGSFTQSKMFHQGVTCSDCHEPHSLKLRAEGKTVCLQCHTQNKYDQATHHFHKKKSRGADCIECHMPQTKYMVVDGRHDHSIRIPRPDLSITLNTPNACNQCHTSKSTKWASRQMEKWYGKDWSPGWHFGETLFEARRGKPGVAQDLAAVAASPKLPSIARATAASMLPSWPGPITSVVTQKLLKDSDPLVRVAAIQSLGAVGAQQRVRLGARLLSDPAMAVRIETARILAPVPRNLIPVEQGAALDAAIVEYRAAQAANAERPEAHLNLGLLETDLRNFPAAEKSYQQALKLDPNFVNAYVNLADLYRMQGRDSEAERALRSGLKISPDNAALQHSLGLLLVRKKLQKSALSSLAKAYRLEPTNARYAYVYAVALDGGGKTTKALSVLVRAHRRHASDRDILLALISFNKKAAKNTAARKYAGKLIQLDPRYGSVDDLLGRLN